MEKEEQIEVTGIALQSNSETVTALCDSKTKEVVSDTVKCDLVDGDNYTFPI